MQKKLAQALRLMKNELDEPAGALAVALQDAIAEAEETERVVGVDDLAATVQAIVRDHLPEVVETPEVSAAINRVARKVRGEGNYLASRQAAKDYLATIRNSRSATDYSRNWAAKLAENGITGLTAPSLVDGVIQTAWGQGSGLFSALRHVSQQNFTIQYDATDGWQQLARGHAKGTNKEAQVLEVSPKLIALQGIYKDQYVDRVDLAAMTDDTTFLRWLVEELSDRLAFTIEAQIIGGGNSGQNDIHAVINGSYQSAMANSVITAFEGIGGKTTADAWTNVSQIDTSTEPASITWRTAALSLNNRGRDIWAYVSPAAYISLATRIYGSGGTPVAIGPDQLAAELGVARVIPWKYFATGVDGVLITPDLYYRIGGEPFGEQSSIWLTNQEAYRAEIFAGGAIAGLKSTAVILSE